LGFVPWGFRQSIKKGRPPGLPWIRVGPDFSQDREDTVHPRQQLGRHHHPRTDRMPVSMARRVPCGSPPGQTTAPATSRGVRQQALLVISEHPSGSNRAPATFPNHRPTATLSQEDPVIGAATGPECEGCPCRPAPFPTSPIAPTPACAAPEPPPSIPFQPPTTNPTGSWWGESGCRAH